MLVSWNWLQRYVDLKMDREELESRLSLSGLNHEGTETSATHDGLEPGDFCIDLEVTSNRGDCLGHIGVAREISVLYGSELKIPKSNLAEGANPIDQLLSVENQFVEACPRYTARVIEGVTIGPSPDWMQAALKAVGIGCINNVVDATNYVMMECGQPLHAFDLASLDGGEIIVRAARDKEIITAIDHRDYELDSQMCVIADSKNASAVAGVMGGANSEVTDATKDIVIEAAIFIPLSVRRTARKLKLHSPSSYRFERRVDPAGVLWSSNRACELIMQSGGGTLAKGVADTHPDSPVPKPVTLTLTELKRILGIEVPTVEIERILVALGCQSDGNIESGKGSFVPPTWRHDLTRPADLIEEVARIHGYDKIPEDSPIPVTPSSKRVFDSATERIRHVMVSSGLTEAMTPSVVTKQLDESVSPWTDQPAIQTQTAMLKGAKRLRRTLMPSLLQARANNWAAASIEANLFEIAHIYLPNDASESVDGLPEELYTVGLVRGGDFFEAKGILEKLGSAIGIQSPLAVKTIDRDGFEKGKLVELSFNGVAAGYLGTVAAKTLKPWKLPGPVVIAELSLPRLIEMAELVPQQRIVSLFPSVERDLNFVMKESVHWNELERVVRSAVGGQLKSIRYRETYRDPAKDGNDRKRILLSLQLQRDDGTLSGSDADEIIQSVVGDCQTKLGAELLG
ncbi:MAG: phenylalanine--tRNA ligase subunit beta [Planctomycetota bacterium]